MKILLIILYFVFSLLTPQTVFSQEKNTIYVYQDEGVSEESLKQTTISFQKLVKNYALKTINAEQVKEGLWTQNAILFVIPGGADIPYVKKLSGQGNKIIRKYVENGGSFLGICAGSYYGASYVEFDKNGALEVLGDRELGFFKGSAIGPILAPYDYKTQNGSRAATIHTTLPNVTETTVFYNGGGFFEHAERYQNVNIIGTYENNLPAIIVIDYGKGKAILSGVHFEYDPYLLNSKDQYIKKIIKPLQRSNNSREILFKYLMKIIGVK